MNISRRNIPTAAKQIRSQTGVEWRVALSWAWQAYREATVREGAIRLTEEIERARKQLEFFEKRRRELIGERYRDRLRSAPIRDHRFQPVERGGRDGAPHKLPDLEDRSDMMPRPLQPLRFPLHHNITT